MGGDEVRRDVSSCAHPGSAADGFYVAVEGIGDLTGREQAGCVGLCSHAVKRSAGLSTYLAQRPSCAFCRSSGKKEKVLFPACFRNGR